MPSSPKPATGPTGPDPTLFGKALRPRRSWSQIKEAFKQRDLKIGGGWEDFLAKLGSDSEDTEQLRDQIGDVYADLILLGRRTVQLFKDSGFDWQEFASTAKGLVPATAPLTTPHLLPAADAVLKAVPQLTPQLVDVREHGSDVLLIFSSHQTYVDREQVKLHELGADPPAGLTRFERLFGESVISFQTFDVVAIRPTDDRLEIWLDDPHGMDRDEVVDMVTRLIEAVATIYSPALSLIGGGVNLFAAIREIYEDKYAGSVAKLWFSTQTGSLKREFMRTKGEDLRVERFHEAGVKEVGKDKISPYAIEVEFTINDRIIPVALKGNFRDLQLAAPSLDLAHIDNCSSIEQMKRAINKLMTFVQ